MKLSRTSSRKFVFIILIAMYFFVAQESLAQQMLTLEGSLSIAMKNSPDIKRVEYMLERSRQSLNAQKAALRSQFNLSITPYDYRKDRRFISVLHNPFLPITVLNYLPVS